MLFGAVPCDAVAQGLGIGGRTTSVRSEADPDDADAERLNGVVARLRLGPRTAIEGSLDYRTRTEDGVARVREYPLQGSILIYPVSTRLAPYLLAGVGSYATRVETLDAGGEVVASTSERRFGTHAGLGAEIAVSRRVSLFGDYRYRFIRFGDLDPDEAATTAPGALPLPGTIGLQERLKLHHEGSMWTFGLLFNF